MSKKKGCGEFFAVGIESFHEAIDMGMNEAVALLVLAAGSGRDNSTTKWSMQAINKYTGIAEKRAGVALANLKTAGAFEEVKGGCYPLRKLKPKGELVWLPNALVTGLEGVTPPIARVRQSGDPLLVRLLVDAYSVHDLKADGGLPKSFYYTDFDRTAVGTAGVYSIYAFEKQGNSFTEWNPCSNPHRITGKNPAAPFFHRVETLLSLGLLESVTYLVEFDGGEPIHALHDSADELAYDVSCSARAAAEQLLPDQMRYRVEDEEFDHVVPVPQHFANIACRETLRLKYRPRTAATGSWWADHVRRCNEAITRYQAIGSSDGRWVKAA